MKPEPHMLRFVVSALRLLVQIPRPWDGRECVPLPLVVLDLGEVGERYQALSSNERRSFRAQWDTLQALMRQQAELAAAATRLGQEITRCIPTGISPRADGLLKELTVKERLAAVIDELPLDPSAVLLEVARSLHRDTLRGDDTPAHGTHRAGEQGGKP